MIDVLFIVSGLTALILSAVAVGMLSERRKWVALLKRYKITAIDQRGETYK